MITNFRYVLAFAALLSVFVGCTSQKEKNGDTTTEVETFSYDFSNPTQRYDFPKVLREISGLSFYRDNQLLCVQDEKGEVFVYDLAQQSVVEKHHFDQPGDYEGVELAVNYLTLPLAARKRVRLKLTYPKNSTLKGSLTTPSLKGCGWR